MIDRKRHSRLRSIVIRRPCLHSCNIVLHLFNIDSKLFQIDFHLQFASFWQYWVTLISDNIEHIDFFAILIHFLVILTGICSTLTLICSKLTVCWIYWLQFLYTEFYFHIYFQFCHIAFHLCHFGLYLFDDIFNLFQIDFLLHIDFIFTIPSLISTLIYDFAISI